MDRLKKIAKIIALAFLVFFSIIMWTNYINPCPQPTTIFVDTCKVDSTIVDSVKLTSDDTVIIDTIKKP